MSEARREMQKFYSTDDSGPGASDITRTSALLFDTVNLDAACTKRSRAAGVRGN
jgi:hypothetical protein